VVTRLYTPEALAPLFGPLRPPPDPI